MPNGLQTLYFSKRFTSGLLKGITVHEKITGSPETLKWYRIGSTGQNFGTKSRWVIVDASYQEYAR